MLGLIRLLTQPKVMGSAALTLSQAWKVYRRFRALPMIDLLVDGGHCEAPLEGYVTSQLSLAPRLWTDAYLAALAHSSDCRLVTFDKDFERFGLSQCLVLATSPGLR